MSKKKKIMKSRKKDSESKKIYQKRENYFKIEKDISESLQESCYKNQEKIFGTECFGNIFA